VKNLATICQPLSLWLIRNDCSGVEHTHSHRLRFQKLILRPPPSGIAATGTIPESQTRVVIRSRHFSIIFATGLSTFEDTGNWIPSSSNLGWVRATTGESLRCQSFRQKWVGLVTNFVRLDREGLMEDKNRGAVGEHFQLLPAGNRLKTSNLPNELQRKLNLPRERRRQSSADRSGRAAGSLECVRASSTRARRRSGGCAA